MYQPPALAVTGGLAGVAMASGLQTLWIFLAAATVVYLTVAAVNLVPRRHE